MKCQYCLGTGERQAASVIGLEFKKMRMDANIGLRDMAKLMRISHSYLCQLEGGTREWRLSMVQRYESIIASSLNEVAQEETHQKPSK